MPGKKNTPSESTFDASPVRPRLSKLIIRNFRAIGNQPVTIDLDKIVVLVGPNNVGKSSILRAYEIAMSEGSKASHMEVEDFPNGTVNPAAPAEIQLETVVFDNSPGERWITVNEAGEKIVRERWLWKEPGKPTRQGYDPLSESWSSEVPWGAPNVANSRRPQPHRINAFDAPEKYAGQIVDLLTAALTERLKNATDSPTESSVKYAKLLHEVKDFQKILVAESQTEIERIETQLTALLKDVLPGSRVTFDAKAETDIEKCLSLFKSSPQLRMGPEDGYHSSIENQGSGARRLLLWAALKTIADTRSNPGVSRPNILLLDEPEICLHPSAIREACKVLYDLPEAGQWQVMLTTHSPVFVDVSRDNTTIVRVERTSQGDIQGTTLFRPDKVCLSADDKELLKLLNICDPYVAEFFFGGRVVVVEGDTEFSVFRQIMAIDSEEFKNVHVIRARGKATIAAVAKILNHFGSTYAILHDADTPTVTTKRGKTMINPAWTTNKLLKDAFNLRSSQCTGRLIASLPNFEQGFFGESAVVEKPYNAICQISKKEGAYQVCRNLLRALLDYSAPVPTGATDWTQSTLTDLESQVVQFLAAQSPVALQ